MDSTDKLGSVAGRRTSQGAEFGARIRIIGIRPIGKLIDLIVGRMRHLHGKRNLPSLNSEPILSFKRISCALCDGLDDDFSSFPFLREDVASWRRLKEVL